MRLSEVLSYTSYNSDKIRITGPIDELAKYFGQDININSTPTENKDPEPAKPEKAERKPKEIKADRVEYMPLGLSRKEKDIAAIKEAVKKKKASGGQKAPKKRERKHLTPEDCAEIVRLHDEEGLSFAEIAKKYGVAIQTCYNRYHKYKDEEY